MFGLARLLLGLPPRRFRVRQSIDWLPLSDGIRLATSVILPSDGDGRWPAVLIRTAEPAHRRAHRTAWLARWIAEAGYAVVAQECRGRNASEGTFEPFRHEADDGAQAVRWLRKQPWCDGRVALAGFGYAGFAAHAAASRAPDVAALVVGFTARDPRTLLYQGGALQLAHALELATRYSQRQGVAPARVDLARAVRHRPVYEADRVALRRVDAYRDWLEHPAPDAFWRERTPVLPSPPPRALFLSSWFASGLAGLLADYEAFAASAAPGAEPELLIGPWHAGRPEAAFRTSRADGILPQCLRALLGFLDRRLSPGSARADAGAPVRLFVGGERRWERTSAWPPPASPLCLHLRSGGRANGSIGDGRLDPAPPLRGEPPDTFRYDPDDPVPSRGGALPGDVGDPREVETRSDLLCYTSAPLERDWRLAGPVRAELEVASSAEDSDFIARLVDVGPRGATSHLCEGALRCRWREGGDGPVWIEPGRPFRLVVELGATGFRFEAGHRVRLEVSSSSLPRFDRNGNVREEPSRATPGSSRPAQQTLFHDAERPSLLVLPLLEPASPDAAFAGSRPEGAGPGGETGPPAQPAGPDSTAGGG